MNIQKIFAKGSEINKIAFRDIEDYLEGKAINVNAAFNLLADEKEQIYVSNGFLSGLKNENTPGEWHHYFKKDGNFFVAYKLKFT